jgi:hypothetical protein
MQKARSAHAWKCTSFHDTPRLGIVLVGLSAAVLLDLVAGRKNISAAGTIRLRCGVLLLLRGRNFQLSHAWACDYHVGISI